MSRTDTITLSSPHWSTPVIAIGTPSLCNVHHLLRSNYPLLWLHPCRWYLSFSPEDLCLWHFHRDEGTPPSNKPLQDFPPGHPGRSVSPCILWCQYQNCLFILYPNPDHKKPESHFDDHLSCSTHIATLLIVMLLYFIHHQKKTGFTLQYSIQLLAKVKPVLDYCNALWWPACLIGTYQTWAPLYFFI